jgi:hypothetical protein
MFILQITLDRHNAILKLNYWPLPDPPNFSLPSTFKPSLWFNSPLPSPLLCVNKYTLYTYTVCKGGGEYGVLGLRQINTSCKIPLQVNFLDD